MPESRRTAAMKKWAKSRFDLFRKRFGSGAKHGKAIRAARRGFSRSIKFGNLVSPRRRSWKGPTRFVPRCRKGHQVDYDMARCYVCSPIKPKAKASSYV